MLIQPHLDFPANQKKSIQLDFNVLAKSYTSFFIIDQKLSDQCSPLGRQINPTCKLCSLIHAITNELYMSKKQSLDSQICLK